MVVSAKAMSEEVIEINPISAASLFIEMMYDDIPLAKGTAFFTSTMI